MNVEPVSRDLLAGLENIPGSGLRRWGSALTLVLLLVVVVAGGLTLLGVRTETARSSANGYTMELDYPRVARAGLDVDWQLTVTHPGGFPKTITLALSADQFDIYEHQAFYPEPDSTTRDADTLLLTFIAPAGDTFTLGFDAYVQPSSQIGRTGTITVMDHHARAATLTYTTTLLP